MARVLKPSGPEPAVVVRRNLNLLSVILEQAHAHLPDDFDASEWEGHGRRALELAATARRLESEGQQRTAANVTLRLLAELRGALAAVRRELRDGDNGDDAEWWDRRIRQVGQNLRDYGARPGAILTGIGATALGVALTFLA